jgi:hypothetical protein
MGRGGRIGTKSVLGPVLADGLVNRIIALEIARAAVVPAKLYSDRLSGILANCSAKRLASTCVSCTAAASPHQ